LLRHSDAIERLRQTTFVTAIRAVVAKVCLIMFGVTVLVILALFAAVFKALLIDKTGLSVFENTDTYSFFFQRVLLKSEMLHNRGG